MRNRKLKAAVSLDNAALRAERTALIVLERGKELELERIDAAQAVDALMSLDPGFDLLEHESRAAIEALASGGAWRLTLAEEPGAAIDFVTARLAAQC
jgi:hypothetical protein